MSRPRALEHIRVVDFSWVRAGPWATRWLGAFGAEIIKIEWPENERGRLPSTTTPRHLEVNLNTSGNFNDTNVNKKSISLNVRTAKGLEIVKRLIAVSDIVIENFSSRVLRNWGLGYEEQRRIKPDIIYVSMSGYGHTGRHHHYTTFGPVAQAVSGLTFLSGLPDLPPAGWGWSYMDDTGGMYGAICALTGLYHRNITGKGQHIDLSQMVASVPLVGPALLDFTVNGRGSRRRGYPPGNRAHWPGTPLLNNYRGPMVAPHNAYRTDPGGYNDWCVIVCQSDEEWARLGAGHGSATLGCHQQIRHGRRSAAASGRIGRTHGGLDEDARQIRGDRTMPSFRGARPAGAKRRGPHRARPSAPPSWNVSGDRAPGARPIQGAECSVQAVGNAGNQFPSQPNDRRAHARNC